MIDTIFRLIGEWLSRSGDTTFWSLIITVLYLITIPASVVFTLRIKADGGRFMLWSCLTIFLLAMGINKQLDFQTLLIILGKAAAEGFGLREHGRKLGKALAVLLFISFLGIGSFVIYRARNGLLREKKALTGAALLLLFTVIRIGAITNIRRFIMLQYVIYRVHALEFLGLAVILYALAVNFRELSAKRASHQK